VWLPVHIGVGLRGRQYSKEGVLTPALSKFCCLLQPLSDELSDKTCTLCPYQSLPHIATAIIIGVNSLMAI